MSHFLNYHTWPGYAIVAGIVAAGALICWTFLKVSVQILTNWQTGRW